MILKRKLTKLETDRSIKEHNVVFSGRMTEQSGKWWQGLAKELEVDIESLDD